MSETFVRKRVKVRSGAFEEMRVNELLTGADPVPGAPRDDDVRVQKTGIVRSKPGELQVALINIAIF